MSPRRSGRPLSALSERRSGTRTTLGSRDAVAEDAREGFPALDESGTPYGRS